MKAISILKKYIDIEQTSCIIFCRYLKDFLKECTQKIDKRINDANEERKQSAEDIVHLKKRISKMNQIKEQVNIVIPYCWLPKVAKVI